MNFEQGIFVCKGGVFISSSNKLHSFVKHNILANSANTK